MLTKYGCSAWGGAAYPWSSAHVLATLILGCVLLIAFGFYGESNPQSTNMATPLALTCIFRGLRSSEAAPSADQDPQERELYRHCHRRCCRSDGVYLYVCTLATANRCLI